PAIAAQNGESLIAFTHYFTQGGGNYDVLAARLDVDGGRLDPTPFTVCGAPADQRHLAATAGGGNFTVAWTDCRSSGSMCFYAPIYAGRVSFAGAPLDGTGVQISSAV